MSNYYNSFCQSSSRASSGSPLSSVYSQSPPSSTGYFSPAPPSPYYYATEYSGSPGSTGSTSSRSSSSQGHHSRSTSNGNVPSASYQGGYVEPQYERASKRQRATAAVTGPTGHLQPPQWVSSSSQVVQGGDPTYSAYPISSSEAYYASSSLPSSSVSSPANYNPYPVSQSQSQPRPPFQSSSTARQPQMPTSQQETLNEETFEHGPTELPPRTFTGQSKFNPPRKPGKIPGSAMDYLPILEARFERLENAIDKYVDYRGQRALSNSILPGSESSAKPAATKPKTR